MRHYDKSKYSRMKRAEMKTERGAETKKLSNHPATTDKTETIKNLTRKKSPQGSPKLGIKLLKEFNSANIGNHPAEGSLLKFNRGSAPSLREEQPLELVLLESPADKTTIPVQLKKIQQESSAKSPPTP
ncbi:hypothetical protein RUM43_009304 [Polyplax serrata]|uniref:Uncharacterized protein n=1 Tax=Polyplax serrata TaxID=468196 RepID=A0AAN8PCN2_POLSC